MPRDDYRTCKRCGRHAREAGALSHTRLCEDCYASRFMDNLDAMKTMSGPFARHWRRQMAASVGAVLLDEAETDA